LYAAAVLATDQLDLVPVRPLYDGLAPPAPYRWVDPPQDLADGNEEPADGDGRVSFKKGKSQPLSVTTGDGQAQVVFKTESLKARRGEKEAVVSIVPLDPADLPEQRGITIDGNAYRVEATYARSKDPATIEQEISIVLRYPAHGREVVRLDGKRWTKLKTNRAETSFQAFADSRQLGIFAVHGAPDPWWRQLISYRNAGVLAFTLALIGYLSGRLKGRRKRRRAKTRQQRRAAARRRGGGK
jgi:hypothetical protein